MELQISHSVCPEVPKKVLLQREESRSRQDIATVMRVEGKPYRRSRTSLMIYEKWGNVKYKFRNREFWCRGYYVDTVGKNKKRIEEYIKNQLKADEAGSLLPFDTNPLDVRGRK